MSGGGQGGLGKLQEAKRLHYCGHFPWSSQVHSGMPRLSEDLRHLRPLLLPLLAHASQKGTADGGVLGSPLSCCQTCTGNHHQPVCVSCPTCLSLCLYLLSRSSRRCSWVVCLFVCSLTCMGDLIRNMEFCIEVFSKPLSFVSSSYSGLILT